mmetsp:Transcript_19051/g.41002  ORF Transcript_19051/g.41002 Transcript_19051/m.41002 type:complete len:279 (-) Transcript_19051:379-1215(-)|eukprot:CAMPEP_0168812272 /NCGR_PEP_ID=MMETSP0726-20121227/4553_1 /TAXON_ID=265536 /ORGANISM="Amphiprora sp., Strain CCMP467" /LENGTH=278 /DNA_ID=CAMNT_0008864357 /DNA_START=111 /DNA_END=947 /DNA_ORIENTATION=-
MASSVAPVNAMEAWPSLRNPDEKCEPATAAARKPHDVAADGPKETDYGDEDYDEWEDIEVPTTEDTSATITLDAAVPEPPMNPKILHHAASSPSLGSLAKHVTPTLDGFILDGVVEEPEHDSLDDFSLVSSVASVKSISTFQSAWSTASVPASKAISWKDKVAQLARDGDNNFGAHNNDNKNKAPASRTPRKIMSNSRFVVKPIQRCTQSTPNLHSLIEEEDGDEGGESMGASDAMEFYSRKAQGAKGRNAGLRMRPDEAKRKQISLHKRNLQRQGRR